MSKKYRPSRLALAWLCRGTIRMSEGLENTQKAEMEMGKRIHEALHGGSPSELKDDFELKLYDTAIGLVEAVEEKMGSLDGWETLREHSFQPLAVPGVPAELWPDGTADLLSMNKKKRAAFLIDYKIGLAPLNTGKAGVQLGCYAAMSFQDFPDVDEIQVSILELARENVYTQVITRGQQHELLQNIRRLIMECEQDCLRLTPSDDVCPHCPGAIRCPAARHELDVYVEEYAKNYLPTPELRGAFLAKATLAAKLAEAYRDYCTEELQKDPNAVKGYILRSRQGNRHIAEVDVCRQRAAGRVGPPEFERECTKVSVGKLEALWTEREATETGITKTVAKERFAKEFEDLISRDAASYWPEKAPERKELTDGRT